MNNYNFKDIYGKCLYIESDGIRITRDSKLFRSFTCTIPYTYINDICIKKAKFGTAGFVSFMTPEGGIDNEYILMSPSGCSIVADDVFTLAFHKKSQNTITKIIDEISIKKSQTSTQHKTPIYADVTTGHQFEYYCAELLKNNGFEQVQVTPGSNDQGVDILAQKDGIKYAIQCKYYSTPLGNTPVQEVNAGKTFYGCHVGVVLTNSTFTPSAKALASSTGVLLWDKNKLYELSTND